MGNSLPCLLGKHPIDLFFPRLWADIEGAELKKVLGGGRDPLMKCRVALNLVQKLGLQPSAQCSNRNGAAGRQYRMSHVAQKAPGDQTWSVKSISQLVGPREAPRDLYLSVWASGIRLTLEKATRQDFVLIITEKIIIKWIRAVKYQVSMMCEALN